MTKIVNILLQRSDQNCPWGFQLMGGKDYGTVVTIRKVSRLCFDILILSGSEEFMDMLTLCLHQNPVRIHFTLSLTFYRFLKWILGLVDLI